MDAGMPTISTPSMGSTKHSGKTIKLKTFLQSKGTLSSPGKRRSLQQLQPLAGESDKLVGKDGLIRSQKPRTPKRKRDGDSERPAKRQFITKPTKKFSVFQDQKLPTKSDGSKVQPKEKTPEEIAYELMVQEEVPEKYWEELAEERRVALEHTLEENEQLHTELKGLKEENAKLKVTADQAVYLAGVVQELLGEGEDDDESDQSGSHSDKSESKECDDGSCGIELVSGSGVKSAKRQDDETAENGSESESDTAPRGDGLVSDSAQITDDDDNDVVCTVRDVQEGELTVSPLEPTDVPPSQDEEDKENTETESDGNDSS